MDQQEYESDSMANLLGVLHNDRNNEAGRKRRRGNRTSPSKFILFAVNFGAQTKETISFSASLIKIDRYP